MQESIKEEFVKNKNIRFAKNQVFKIDANYGYQSFIEFAENEKVKTIAIGDGVSWNINPSDNKIFLPAHTTADKVCNKW